MPLSWLSFWLIFSPFKDWFNYGQLDVNTFMLLNDKPLDCLSGHFCFRNGEQAETVAVPNPFLAALEIFCQNSAILWQRREGL